ncbi:Uncharacterised protein [Mycobacteroides abscessus subsp. massiliense]|nr:Uncharacterised protein [Mycobacteroides abscessus subsp. massiliense]
MQIHVRFCLLNALVLDHMHSNVLTLPIILLVVKLA